MLWWLFWAAVVLIVAIAVVWTWTHPTLARKLYANSRTLFLARSIQVASVLLFGYDIAAPILMHPDFALVIPKDYLWAWPLAMFAVGQIFARLRQFTDKSLAQRKVLGASPIKQLVPGVKQ